MRKTRMNRMMKITLVLALLCFSIFLSSCKDAEVSDVLKLKACEGWDDNECVVKMSPNKHSLPVDSVIEGGEAIFWLSVKLGGTMCDADLFDKYESSYQEIAELEWIVGFEHQLDGWEYLGTTVGDAFGTCDPAEKECYLEVSIADMAGGAENVGFTEMCVEGTHIPMRVRAPEITGDSIGTTDTLEFFFDGSAVSGDDVMDTAADIFKDECYDYVQDEYGDKTSDKWVENGEDKCDDLADDIRNTPWEGPPRMTVDHEPFDNGWDVQISNVRVNSLTDVNIAEQRSMAVPFEVQVDNVESDLSNLHFLVMAPEGFLVNSFSGMSDSMAEIDFADDGANNWEDFCEEYPTACGEMTANPDKDIPYHPAVLYSAPMAALMTDGDALDNLEVNLDAYMDMHLTMESFFSGERPLLVVPGVSSTIPLGGQDPLDNIKWLLGDSVDSYKVTSQSEAFHAECEDLPDTVDMFVGETREFTVTMRNPQGFQNWGNQFALLLDTVDLNGWTLLTEDGDETNQDFVMVDPQGGDPEAGKAGGSYDFTFYIRAPEEGDIAHFSWQMASDGSNVFGQVCEMSVFVTDSVVPGWNVAHGAGFTGYEIDGVHFDGDMLYLREGEEGKSGVVSVPTQIPTEGAGNYIVSAELGSPDLHNSYKIQLLNAVDDSPLQGTHEWDDQNYRITFTPDAELQGDAEYRILIWSTYEAESEDDMGSSIHDVAFYNTDEVPDLQQDVTEYYFEDSTAPLGCCPSGSCWSGNECVEAGETDNFQTPIACDELGNWVVKEQKHDFYGMQEGYCMDATMCFSATDEFTGCVPNGWSSATEDKFCAEGNWTTRTAAVASQLLDIAQSEATEYALYCGLPGDALNFMAYDPNFGQNAYVKDILQCESVDEGKMWCNNINNVCVLEMVHNNQLKTMIGLTTNIPIDASAESGGILPALGLDQQSCVQGNAMDQDYEYDECVSDSIQVSLDNNTKSLIIEPDYLALGLSEVQWNSINTLLETQKESGSFDVFGQQDAIWDNLQNLAITYEDDDSSEADFTFIENFRHMNNFYYANWNGKEVFGVKEGYKRVPQGVEEPYLAYFSGVLYSGFNDDLCPALEMVRDTYTEYPAPDSCQDQEFGCCFSSDRTTKLNSDEFAIYSDATAVEYLSEGVFRYFPDLTTKVRLG